MQIVKLTLCKILLLLITGSQLAVENINWNSSANRLNFSVARFPPLFSDERAQLGGECAHLRQRTGKDYTIVMTDARWRHFIFRLLCRIYI